MDEQTRSFRDREADRYFERNAANSDAIEHDVCLKLLEALRPDRGLAVLEVGCGDGWRLERIDSVLRAILRAGTYELMARLDVPAPVVINEYVNLAHAFFDGKEPGFANAVLDTLVRRLRPDDVELPNGEEAADPQ